MNDRTVTVMFWITAIITLALIVGLSYVAIHFLGKVW